MGNTFTDTYGGGGNTFSTTHGNTGGNTFSNTYGSSSRSGGYSTAIHHPSGGGGGGFFGSGFIHGAEGLASNFIAGLYEANKSAVQDIGQVTSGHAPTHLLRNVVEPTGYAYKNKYYSRNVLHNIEKDPFGTALDALALGSVALGGEGLAIRGATLADRLGVADTAAGRALVSAAERARLARANRVITYVPKAGGEGVTFEAARARTLQGRLVYNPVREAIGRAGGGERFGVFSDAARAAKFQAKQLDFNASMVANRQAAREFNDAISANLRPSKRLTKAERFAVPLMQEYGPQTAIDAALGAPRIQRLDFYKAKLAETNQRLAEIKGMKNREKLRGTLESIARTQNRMVSLLGDEKFGAKLDEAIKNPKPHLLDTIQKADEVARRQGDQLVARGMDPAALEARRHLSQYVMHGYVQEPLPEGGYQWVHPNPGEGVKSLEQIQAEHPDAAYFPHTGPEITPEGARVRPSLNLKREPSSAKLNEAVRLSSGTMTMGPEAYSRSFVQNLSYEATRTAVDLMRGVMIPVHNNEVLDGYHLVNPEGVSLSRFQREEGAMHEHYASLSNRAHEARMRESLNAMFPEKAAGQDVSHLMQVPDRFVKQIQRDYQRSHLLVRKFIDLPLAIWKALVLKYRPAWLVNNILGQHMLLLLHHPFFFNDYVKSLSPSKRAELDKGIHALSMGGTSELIRHHTAQDLGFEDTLRARIKNGEIGGIVGKGLYRVPSYPWKVVKGFGDGMAKANLLIADDMTRFTLARHYLKGYAREQRVRELAAAQRAGKGFTEANDILTKYSVKGKTLEQIAHDMPEEAKIELLRKVDSALGDFNTLRSPAGKTLRRLVPFAAWFKVILEISRDLLVEHPEKVWFIYQLEQAAKKDPSVTPQFDVPSWFVGSLLAPWFKTKPGEVPLISTNTANPFATPQQLADQLGVLFKSGQPSGTASPIASLGPAAESVNLLQGFDPFYGGAYTGPGDKSPGAERVALGLLAGLPPVRLANEAGLPLTGKYKQPASYQDRFMNVGGHDIPLDAILRYLGLPIRRANKAKLQEYAQRGL